MRHVFPHIQYDTYGDLNHKPYIKKLMVLDLIVIILFNRYNDCFHYNINRDRFFVVYFVTKFFICFLQMFHV